MNLQRLMGSGVPRCCTKLNPSGGLVAAHAQSNKASKGFGTGRHTQKSKQQKQKQNPTQKIIRDGESHTSSTSEDDLDIKSPEFLTKLSKLAERYTVLLDAVLDAMKQDLNSAPGRHAKTFQHTAVCEKIFTMLIFSRAEFQDFLDTLQNSSGVSEEEINYIFHWFDVHFAAMCVANRIRCEPLSAWFHAELPDDREVGYQRIMPDALFDNTRYTARLLASAIPNSKVFIWLPPRMSSAILCHQLEELLTRTSSLEDKLMLGVRITGREDFDIGGDAERRQSNLMMGYSRATTNGGVTLKLSNGSQIIVVMTEEVSDVVRRSTADLVPGAMWALMPFDVSERADKIEEFFDMDPALLDSMREVPSAVMFMTTFLPKDKGSAKF